MPDLKKRLSKVALYAIAMAWVEAAVVVYLRYLVGRLQPYQPDPLPVSGGFEWFGWIETGREAATLLMLWAIGSLAGRTWKGRAGYALLAFGLWDIFYYLFLVPMSGWPASVMDWDILFLIPLPWWGPVLAPVLISLLLIGGGVLAARAEDEDLTAWPRAWTWLLNAAGVLLALYTFMATAIKTLPEGAEAVRSSLPLTFNWPLFILALLLMAAPVLDLGRQMMVGHTKTPGAKTSG